MSLAAAFAAIVILGLLYSVTRIQNWNRGPQLKPLELTLSSRQKVPQFEWSGTKNRAEEGALKTEDLQNQWTLLSFWAYWCTPCMVELPTLAQLNTDWSGPELRIITVNEDDPQKEDFEAAKKFVADAQISTGVIYDTEKKIEKAFGVTALPTHFLINPHGEIVWSHTGAIAWNSLESERQLLKVLEAAE